MKIDESDSKRIFEELKTTAWIFAHIVSLGIQKQT